MEFPLDVGKSVGGALSAAQFGEMAEDVKTWKGEGSGVFEIVERHDGNAL
jgi:phage-related protein